MRDIKLENNINLRESEKDISGGISAASDVDNGQREISPVHNSDLCGNSANDTDFAEDQVYRDKQYEITQ